ncbi:MAG TPA: amidohydrolase family protein [Bryobacteraceae bacterium]|nr:amidohydrolase family protein [Bryobacteraceae bacterium]
METPWGDLPVCDAHVHFFSPGFFAALAAQGGRTLDETAGILDWRIPATNEELAGAWIRELDQHDLSKTVLIASIPGDEASVESAVSLYPGRFYGYFMVDPLAAEGAARVTKALAGGHLQGICLFPAMHRYSIADARVRPVLEAAAAHPGSIVLVHCGVLTVGVRRKLGLPSPFDMRYSNPIDLHAAALDFPSVNFVVPHFGAGYFREALMLCDLCPNVHLDTSSSNSWLRYQLEPAELKDVFRKALEVAGPQRLLFGSDSSFFPRGWHAQILETQMQALSDLNISPEHAAMILGGNLERLARRP